MTLHDKLQLINKLKERADAIKPPKMWDQAFLEKIKIEFTYRSNQIKGNTITFN